MKRLLVCAAVVVMVSGCSSAGAPAEESSPSPSEAAVESPSASPDVPVDPMSAQIICQDLRLWDAYRQADLPQEETDMFTLGLEISTKGLEADAEPELREIALEHMGDPEASADAMIPWCQENTESAHEGDPW